MLNIFGLEISTKKLINSALYLLFIFIIYLIIRRILKIALTHAGGKRINAAQRQRVKTVSQMLSSLLKYMMLILTLLVILADLGVNVSSLIAGLGILTAVMGLAFQDMIKDFIAGVTILVEGQFCIGDVVEIDGFTGTVLSVGLKTTEIKNSNGQVKIIANHNIDGLVNYSKFNATAVVEVRTAYDTDESKVVTALGEVRKRVARRMHLAISEITFTPAADDLDAEGVSYQMYCPCKAENCPIVQGMIREEILKEFKAQKITIPYHEVNVKNHR